VWSRLAEQQTAPSLALFPGLEQRAALLFREKPSCYFLISRTPPRQVLGARLLWSTKMTTANRPTYYPAVGKQQFSGLASRHFAARDQTAHTKLKFRQLGQASLEESKDRSTRKAELDRSEKLHTSSSDVPHGGEERAGARTPRALLIANQPTEPTETPSSKLAKYDDADVSCSEPGDDFDSSR
jgi:hypothetical protein